MSIRTDLNSIADKWELLESRISALEPTNLTRHESVDDTTILDGACETREIKNFAITWTFDKHYRIGRFANGDPWVVGPVTIVNIDPLCVIDDGATKHGSMINPSPNSKTVGYDSDLTGYGVQPNYSEALNVARSFPLLVNPGSSLISTKSYMGNMKRQLSDASVLTVVDSPMKVGDFRPPYVSGVPKTAPFNVSDISVDVYTKILQSVAPLDNVLSQAKVERTVQRVWLDHIYGAANRWIAPVNNMKDYGMDISGVVSSAWLWLHLDKTDEEKQTLLYSCLQKGIDNYGIGSQVPNNWKADGGIGSGRYWPIIFAGIVFGNSDYKNILDICSFQENEQTFYVSEDDMEKYKSDDLGLAEWGIRHFYMKGYTKRYLDDPLWTASYRRIAYAWIGQMLAALMTNYQSEDWGKAVWNHDSFFDYVDRYQTVEEGNGKTWEYWSAFQHSLYHTYRENYRSE